MYEIICFFERNKNIPFYAQALTLEDFQSVYTKSTITEMFEYSQKNAFFEYSDTPVENCLKRIYKIKSMTNNLYKESNCRILWFQSDKSTSSFLHDLTEFLEKGHKVEEYKGYKEEL